MRLLAFALLLPVLGACATSSARTVLFLCPYGGAKSVIAASYFNRLAAERALPFHGVAAAAEEPYDAVPPPVAGFLKRDGFDLHAFKPRRVEEEDVRTASKVVAIDCSPNLDGVPVERWDDVPKVSVDLEASAAAIRRHVEALVEELERRP